MINFEKLEIKLSNIEHYTNSYIVYNEKKDAFLIDPADNAGFIIQKLQELNLNLRFVILTHTHADHIGALEEIINKYNVCVFLHKSDYDVFLGKKDGYFDLLCVKKQSIKLENIKFVKDNEEILFGDDIIKIIHTPGHTSGSICIFVPSINVLFSGDTIFKDCYGRCDLDSGNIDDMASSLRKVFDMFKDNEILVCPGHGSKCSLNDTKRKLKLMLAVNGKVI